MQNKKEATAAASYIY
ncbi:Protein of unknown function [Bacillus wiedmannii]|nr:Protein of unknown function [Bacillus wiedmannii]